MRETMEALPVIDRRFGRGLGPERVVLAGLHKAAHVIEALV
jgi:hypothetical protein